MLKYSEFVLDESLNYNHLDYNFISKKKERSGIIVLYDFVIKDIKCLTNDEIITLHYEVKFVKTKTTSIVSFKLKGDEHTYNEDLNKCNISIISQILSTVFEITKDFVKRVSGIPELKLICAFSEDESKIEQNRRFNVYRQFTINHIDKLSAIFDSYSAQNNIITLFNS